ncbi:arginine--tRNA ligase [Desulfovibrio sulfodismutans]|uniref:Arginine--tRNA ligase n=1 Tax=Desulfolutivibrio sulfodismutans TaxID=63561 RepID=A0A7K3NQR8_9BACT|nr:arginine--tRNA ligase [Desulfolutivibrio sulfodismutans]NDY58528.1 arginine--tRNA ligase [Desulfolutivibrio sulfodismutans]QLA10891.1 arginine--tRNA ligase [Desulfolutivibrio sulfodismutans DSM 3696]
MRAVTHLRSLLSDALAGMGIPWPEKTTIEPPRDAKFGDLATNAAMMAAKAAGQKPRDLAEALRQALVSADPGIAAEVAGPGFLNVTFPPAFWQATIADVLEQDAGGGYGRSDLGGGKKIQVEYVSANPTGPLHIGHGRGAALGDTLARILRAAGFDVSTEYYINDAGRQMRLLGNSIWLRYREFYGKDVVWPEDWYKGEYIIDLARELSAIHGMALFNMPEAEAIAICQTYGVDSIMAGIKKDLADFRVSHEVWFSEKTLVSGGRVEATLSDLKARGLAYEKDGALWFASENLGDDKDRVLRKSSGELTYFASDICYHADKFARGFEVVVDIWGADHHGYVPRMNAAVQALGRTPDSLKVILVQLVNLLSGGEQIAMSTRAGKFETLADVVAEVGTDAARFMFLSRKSDSHLDFDLELVKRQTMDNPVYYVQYAHARVKSLFAKAAERGIAAGTPDEALLSRLSTPEDLGLLRQIEQFPDVVATAAATFSPHVISYYLRDLAGRLHSYYAAHQVLATGDEELTRARMHLLDAVARVVRAGLALLGVSAPEKMERSES